MSLDVTNRIQSLPVAQVAREELTDEYGLYPMDRVVSPMQPAVVRHDSPEGPVYQEARICQFLLTSMKFPGLARMDDGRLVLSAVYENKPGLVAPKGLFDHKRPQPILLTSCDDGKSWSQPRPTDMYRAILVNLGGKRLMSYGSDRLGAGLHLWFSDDAGETWGDKEPVLAPSNGQQYLSDLAYTPLVEGQEVRFIGYAVDPAGRSTRSFIQSYHAGTHTWNEPRFFPNEQQGITTNEGALVRARNGNLVAALRTTMPDVPAPCDHWDGISTRVSEDDGKTWSDPSLHFRYGHHHTNLLLLPDGRILMTYVARVGELEGATYHGVEAVLSRDNGVTWDWERRYILFRWPLDQCTHSPQSKILSDGRILTVFMHSTTFSWTDSKEHPTLNGVNLVHVGNISLLIWRA